METSGQPAARILAALLVGHGITDVVVSPGSRNAPLVVAASRCDQLRIHVVVDERQAAFVALGIAIQSSKPVALICTSGTALLNYAPAVAEAYYRCIPLIVVSADRPERWIDQDDSQTIRQYEALDNIVNMSVDVSSDCDAPGFVWFTNRKINDAILASTGVRPGPVHINIRLDEPLDLLADSDDADAAEHRIITAIRPETGLETRLVRQLAAEAAPPQRILIVAGFLPPDERLTRALTKLAAIPNVAVFFEAQSNLHHIRGGYGHIDLILSSCDEQRLREMTPDLVITLGGSLVSRMIKKWLRGAPELQHWHVGVGPRGRSVDVFQCLTRRIEVNPVVFMGAFASAMQLFRSSKISSYGEEWRMIINNTKRPSCREWSDLKAVCRLVERLDRCTNLHVSNGTSIRYLQLTDYRHLHRIECNRGVSGIDGSTSTAIGAALAYSGPTVLLTGDMSAQYDIGALTLDEIPSRFAMVILNNGGGDIFRVIASTRNLPERERYFAKPGKLSFEAFARAANFEYLSAHDIVSLDYAISHLNAERKRPLLVEIKTNDKDNASLLRQYLGGTNRLKL